MRPFTSEDDGQSRAPRACADDSNAAHLRVTPDDPDSVRDFVPNSVPNFDSVPAARRPIFWRCFQMTSAETRAIKSSCREYAYSWRAHASKGKAAATATHPSETYRKARARTKNSTTMHKMDFGVSKIKAPRLVATPLPPRNFSQTGNRWPSTAKNAAVVMKSCWCGPLNSTRATGPQPEPLPPQETRAQTPSGRNCGPTWWA